jgi:hypothetical protein
MAGKSQRLFASLILACSSPVILGTTDLTSNRSARLLAAQNRERDAAGLPLLKWDDRLARSSLAWAEHLKRIGTLVHYESDPKDPDPEGENLWAGTRGYYSPEAMVGLWIAEKKHFKQGTFPRNSKTGRVDDVAHYTQVMWRSTSHVGCAVTQNRKEEFLVCRYSEGGNVIGEQPF